MKLKLLTIGALSIGLMSCNESSNNNVGSGGATKSLGVSTIYSSKCLLKGGVASIDPKNFPTKLAKGVNHQVSVYVTCGNNAVYDVTTSTKFTVNNPNILTIDKNGLIVTKTVGNTIIGYSYNGGETHAHNIKVDNANIHSTLQKLKS